MVYITRFEEFRDASRELFSKSPRLTRYTCKYRSPSDGAPSVVLKVTDDKSCLKFECRNKSDMKYIDQFTQLFASWSVLDSSVDEYAYPIDTAIALKQVSSAAGDVPKKGELADTLGSKNRKKKRKAA